MAGKLQRRDGSRVTRRGKVKARPIPGDVCSRAPRGNDRVRVVLVRWGSPVSAGGYRFRLP